MLEINFIHKLEKILPVDNVKKYNNEVIITAKPKTLFNVLSFLKNHVYHQFTCLTAISGTDYPERKKQR